MAYYKALSVVRPVQPLQDKYMAIDPKTLLDSRQKIANIESRGHGDYVALGPVLKSGAYKGDRAYGRYQMMGKNIPQWSKQVLGRSVTPQELLKNPELQDKIFDGIFGGYIKKYGSPEKAAKVWFGGEGGLANSKAKDVLGTTVEDYAKKFTGSTVADNRPDTTTETMKNVAMNDQNTTTGPMAKTTLPVDQSSPAKVMLMNLLSDTATVPPTPPQPTPAPTSKNGLLQGLLLGKGAL